MPTGVRKLSPSTPADLESFLSLIPAPAFFEANGDVLAWNTPALTLRHAHTADPQPLERVLIGSFPTAAELSDSATSFACAMLCADGRIVPVHGAVSQLETTDGPGRLIVCMEHTGVDDLSQGEGSVLHDVLDGSPEALAITRGGRALYVNSQFSRLFCRTNGECLGKPLDELITPAHLRQSAEELYAWAQRDGLVKADTVRRDSLGNEIAVQVTVRPIHVRNDERGLFHVFRDIRTQKQVEAMLEHQALHDPLTGLANRALLLDRLQMALKRLRRDEARHFTVMFLDLDGFKAINDTLGHDEGDRLLRQVGHVLRDCLRPEDTLARFGGDEFALLFDNITTEEQAHLVADRLQQVITDLRGGISASIGISLVKSGAIAPARALHEADVAMYAAKTQGKARSVLFQPGMRIARKELRSTTHN